MNALYLFAVAAVCFSPAVPLGAADVTFTRITSGPVASGVSGAAAAWGDYNNDGFIDLYVTTLNGPSYLYRNNGDGTFTSITGVPIVAGGVNSFGCVWADYDNDGFLDLFQGGYNLSSRLFRNNGDGTFARVTTGAIGNTELGANNVLWADYDNDGFADLFIATSSLSSPQSLLYHNNRDGSFTRIINSVVNLAGNSQGASWGDYDNDGRLDLVIDQTSGRSHVYHNLGDGAFTEVTNAITAAAPATFGGASWGDYDNDGLLDLFVSSYGAHSALYHNDGNGNFSRVTNSVVYANTAKSTGGAWADYDNDGWLDLFVGNDSSAKSFLYHNNGDGTFTAVTNGPVVNDLGTAQGGAWGDYNNDGFPDLFVPNIRSSTHALYRNSGNSNAWLLVRLEGRMSNRAAIGAKVRLKATIAGREFWQLREISGGGSLGSQNDLRAGFGLADATQATVVRIEWPSGIVQELHDIPARQILTVVEPEARISPAALAVERGGNATFSIISTLEGTLRYQWNRNGVELPGETNSLLSLTNVQAEQIGSYSARIDLLEPGLSFNASPALLSGPVVILQPPTNQNVFLGSNITFQVVAKGVGTIAYRWVHNNQTVPGATNTFLTVTNAQLLDEGTYRVVISNSFGEVTSSDALSFVLIKPIITRNPASQSVVAGGSVTLSVSASGHPLPMSYRWRRNLITQTNIITDSSDGFYTVTNLQATPTTNLIHFIVVVTNLAGASAFSTDAVVTVLPDADGDGIPDDWEIAAGLDPHDPSDAALDSDGDGLTNLQEYQSGTDPVDPANRLKIDGIKAESNGNVALEFATRSNRTYTVQWKDAVAAWARLADLPAETTNGTARILDGRANSAGEPRFYRLVSPRQP